MLTNLRVEQEKLVGELVLEDHQEVVLYPFFRDDKILLVPNLNINKVFKVYVDPIFRTEEVINLLYKYYRKELDTHCQEYLSKNPVIENYYIELPHDLKINALCFISKSKREPSKENYSNKRVNVDGLKIGIEFEIPKYPGYRESFFFRYLNYFISELGIIYEHDGSVEGGELKTFEPVSIRKARFLLERFALFRREFDDAFNDSSIRSGVHIHFNITHLPANKSYRVKKSVQKISEYLQDNYRYFKHLVSIYGRFPNRYCNKVQNSSRYEWINLKNRETVEFRLLNSKRRSYSKAFNLSLIIFKTALKIANEEITLEDGKAYITKKLKILSKVSSRAEKIEEVEV